MDNHSARRVTRADVARIAGTSVAVVSYVINNGPRPVAEATRLRVLAAIEQTGYRPNDIARALASGSTQTYGLGGARIFPTRSSPRCAGAAARGLQPWPRAAAAATPATTGSANMS
ncbi:hypothetical protein AK51_24605 [Serratia nematodiphila DZ0503SBS1]|nr:hypothetical protein AK51_24605 [Serratia nematodiphila DZ0503SBS1]